MLGWKKNSSAVKSGINQSSGSGGQKKKNRNPRSDVTVQVEEKDFDCQVVRHVIHRDYCWLHPIEKKRVKIGEQNRNDVKSVAPETVDSEKSFFLLRLPLNFFFRERRNTQKWRKHFGYDHGACVCAGIILG